MWVCCCEMWKRQKESDESGGGGHFTAAAANGFSGLMRISSRGSVEQEERAWSCTAPAKHTRAPDQKPFFYFPVRIRRRLIAGAPFPAVFQLSGNVSGEKRERNDRWLSWQVPKGSLGRRIAPAAGGVMQKAAHRCNAACIKQLLCGFLGRRNTKRNLPLLNSFSSFKPFRHLWEYAEIFNK